MVQNIVCIGPRGTFQGNINDLLYSFVWVTLASTTAAVGQPATTSSNFPIRRGISFSRTCKFGYKNRRRMEGESIKYLNVTLSIALISFTKWRLALAPHFRHNSAALFPVSNKAGRGFQLSFCLQYSSIRSQGDGVALTGLVPTGFSLFWFRGFSTSHDLSNILLSRKRSSILLDSTPFRIKFTNSSLPNK